MGAQLAADGQRLLVGGRGLMPVVGGSETTPQAFLFERGPDGGWTEVAVLDSDASSVAQFPTTPVALDGDYAFVQRNNINPLEVWSPIGSGAWSLVQELGDDGPFGVNLLLVKAIAADDGRLVVSQSNPIFPVPAPIKVYERDASGTYAETAEISTLSTLSADALALDGDRLLTDGPDGNLELYVRSSSGSWGLSPASIPLPFGALTGLALDGNRAAVAGSGQVELWIEDGQGNWTIEQVLTPTEPFPAGGISGVDLDGPWLVVGRASGGPTVGGAVVYRRSSTGTWEQVVGVTSTDPVVANGTGNAVALGDGFVAVGSSGSSNPHPGSAEVAALGSLWHGDPDLSIAGAGSQDLLLRAGSDFAGQLAVLLGSATGSAPGVPLPGGLGTLPLVFDSYTQLALSGGTPLSLPFGFLDGDGALDSSVDVPPGVSSSLAGLSLLHAFVTLDPFGNITSGSNAVRATFVP